jgi:Glyoxalase/Bleomycin resistance protein/Dioxygenase superfamily
MLGGPVQIAYAVDDVFDAAARWVAAGVGPFFVLEHIELLDVRVRGASATFDHSSAFAQWGSVMVELICQHDGGDDPIVAASGLHHVAHFVDDIDSAVAWLAGQGLPQALAARTGAGTPFAFHDARATRGHYIEIYERAERLVRFYEMVRDAATGWGGADPIRRL